MKFRTEIPVGKYPFDLDYQSKILFLGSCFSDNVSKLLIQSGFSVKSNPFGVLYNPISIKNALELLIEKKRFKSEDLFLHNGAYHSFSHHGSFSDASEDKALEKINTEIDTNHQYLKEADILFITLGTAYVYQDVKTESIVSNCHKLPAKNFNHFALTADEISTEYKSLIEKLKVINPKIKLVFTVSPIRHWKDGAHENQLSKATLHLAISQLQKELGGVFYYPSYELVMDDLRDYRFYSDDLVHLNSQAVSYIYEHFQNTFYSEQSKLIEKRVLKLKQALNHRAFSPESKEHQEFLQNTEDKIEQLKKEFPAINIEYEKRN